jgi:hypothetical protein
MLSVNDKIISPLQKGTTPGTTPERIGQDLNLLP